MDVAVAPHRQRSGIGSRLIRTGLERARSAGWQGVLVLGDPGYCRRFGFASPHTGPRLMALALGPDLPARGDRMEYAPAFGQEAVPIHDP